MDLIVDIGNSFYKFFIFKNDKIIEETKTSDTDKASKYINNLITRKNTIKKAIISSVKSESDKIYMHIKQNFSTLDFNNNLKLPVKIEYDPPEALGKDRIAVVCGAAGIYPDNNILVIDAGTAITYDIIEKENRYIGGNISPGINIRFKSLHNFTDKLPLLNIEKNNKKFVGQTTNDAIICGVQNGIIYEVNAYISEFKKKYRDIKIIFTGGDAFFFDMLIKNDIFVLENLTAIGLKKILDLNA